MVGIIIGDRIRRLYAENKGIARQMKITNNIKITNVKRETLGFEETKREGLVFDFEFETVYGETGSKIEVAGSIYFTDDKKALDDIEKGWKEKKLDPKIAVSINNRALEAGFLQAMMLANQVKLPAPMSLPRFVQSTKEEAQKK